MVNNTVFLSGKITGDYDHREKFGSASQALTLAGFTVIDPSILPSSGFAWEAYMRMTLAMLNECDTVCFLPDWRDSRGAVWEYGQAVASGKSIFFYEDWLLERVEKAVSADE